MGRAWAKRLQAAEGRWVRGIQQEIFSKIVAETEARIDALRDEAEVQRNHCSDVEGPELAGMSDLRAADLQHEAAILEAALVDYQAYKFFGFK
ncbi:hypothetical protein [Rhodococcus erythropolis]|jgi:hypothetical protein|uniref:hypothetical protein n=1 Tax=Rhodococcus erythropolis TaxID=1833 RepID=UPI0008CE7B6F|nr:hypothetical protein [Rhodococcus erythropolis]MDF2467669.1 hypothetical protein [Rhodococcus erythropolis]OFV78892.1 hypothetical protein RERY_04390 [Rhodococcus erythropolis]